MKKLSADSSRVILVIIWSFVFQFAVQKYKGPDIWNYNFACCFV